MKTKNLFYALLCAATLTAASCRNDNALAVSGIEFSSTTVTLAVGKTAIIAATVLPHHAANQNVAWASSDTAVATVSNGTVTAVSEGTATITATTEDGGKTATCTVTVVTIDVIDVTLNRTIDTLAVGKTLTLTATVRPDNATNKNVTWISSDTSVATVNNGKVEAVSVGAATIIVTTEDGSKTATCTVTVVIPVTSIKLNRTTGRIVVGQPTVLKTTIYPDSATNKNVVWTSSNTAVAMVSNGVVMTVGSGTATITATTVDGGKTATCTLSAYIPYDGHMTFNGLTWAKANVDAYQTFATRPDMYTLFYQWNKSKPTTSEWSKVGDTAAVWSTANNPCPIGWRLPTSEELDALNKAGSTWVGAKSARGNEVSGSFYGANHATCWLPDNMTDCIFLPASGSRQYLPSYGEYGVLMGQSYFGYYWSRTHNSSSINFYLYIHEHTSSIFEFEIPTTDAYNVRCVQ